MCLINIKETVYIKEYDPPRTGYKVTWIDTSMASVACEFTGPFSAEPIVRGEWRMAADGVDHTGSSAAMVLTSYGDRIIMKPNPGSGLRASYSNRGPCYHVFWSQKAAAKYIMDFLNTFDYMDNRMCTHLRIEVVQVRGTVETGVLEPYVPGAGLTAATATHIKFEYNA
jgi:hypothetical protein